MLLSSGIYAQHGSCSQSIHGKIQDIHSKEPLPFATVKIIGTDTGVIANEQGEFSFEHICEKEVDLEIRFIGYKSIIHHHDFHHPAPTIYLASEETLLEGVVIEGISQEIEVETLSTVEIKADELERLGATAGDLLEKAAGVSTLKTGQNVVKPIVHGLHSNRVLIINNGVRHSYQGWGEEHAPELDPSQIEKIKLVKGAATVRYGPQAIGGVILLDALTPVYNEKLNGNTGLNFQNNGRTFSGKVGLGEGYKRVAWNMAVSGTKQGDLKAPDYFLTNTSKEESGFSLSGRFHSSRLDLHMYASHFDQTLGILRGSVVGNLTDLAFAMRTEPPQGTRGFSYEIRNPKQKTTHDLLKLKSSLHIGAHRIDGQYAFQKNIRKEFDIRRGTNNKRPSINLELITHSFDLDWWHPQRGNRQGSSGIQLLTQNNDNIPGTNTIPFIPNYNHTGLGIYTIESLKNGKATYEAGLRYDLLNMDIRGRNSRNKVFRDNLDYNNLTFTLGYSVTISDELRFSTNLGSAWRAPSVGELYSFGKHQFVVEYGLWRYELFPENDSISTASVLTSAQKNIDHELGFKWIAAIDLKKPHWQAAFTPYVNYIQDYFFTRPYGLTNTVRGFFPFFIYDQTDALYAGFDLDIRKQHSLHMESEFKMSYIYARDVKNNQFFLGIPPLQLAYAMKKTFNGLQLNINGTWTSKQWNHPNVFSPDQLVSTGVIPDRSGTFDFVASPKGYFLLNTAVTYTYDNLKAHARINNVLNTSYRSYTDRIRYFADDLGRNFSLTLDCAF